MSEPTSDVQPIESAGDPPTSQHVHRARLSFHPHVWTWLTDGELQDHRVWGTLVKLFEPRQEEPASTPAAAKSAQKKE